MKYVEADQAGWERVAEAINSAMAGAEQPSEGAGEDVGQAPAGFSGVWSDLTPEERGRVLSYAQGLRDARRSEE